MPQGDVSDRGQQTSGQGYDLPGLEGVRLPALDATPAQQLPVLKTQASTGIVLRLRRQLQQLHHAGDTLFAGEEAHGRAFLFVPVCLAGGAVVWFSLPADPSRFGIVFGCILFSIAAFAARYRAPALKYGTAACALLAAGMLLADFECWRRATVILDSPVTTMLTGRVERREDAGEGRWRYIVRLDGTADPVLKRPPVLVSMLARSRHTPVGIGSGITGRARLSPPSGPALPGLNDFAFGAYFDGIGAVGYFYGAPAPISPPGDTASSHLTQSVPALIDIALSSLRSGIGERIRQVVPGDAGAFAAAIVTDERRAMSKETTEALRLSGLAHIIAISGLNMALAAGIFFVGVRSVLSLFTGFAQAYPVKKIAAAGALMAACAYYLISGFAVSAERAFLMMAIMLTAVFFDRPSISLRNVALSAILILLISPSEVMGPSFQMSFAATLALVAGYALWKEGPKRDTVLASIPAVRPGLIVWRFFAGIFLTSMIGGISTAIFSIEHFHRLATYGLPANLAAMPIISFIVMPAGLMAMLLMPFGLDAVPLRVMGYGLELVIIIGKTVAGWSGEVDFGRLHPAFFPLSSAGFLLLTLLKTRLRHIGSGLMAAAVLIAATADNRAIADLIVSEDGRLVALRENNVLNSNRARPPDFIFSQWRRALVIDAHNGPEILERSGTDPPAEKISDKRRKLSAEERDSARKRMRSALAEGQPRRFICLEKSWCVAHLQTGETIAVLDDAAYLGPACDVAGVVIVPVRLRSDTCRSGARLISLRTLRRTGAIEIRFPPARAEPEILSAALLDMERPWTRHRLYDWRTGTFEHGTPSGFQAPFNGSGE